MIPTYDPWLEEDIRNELPEKLVRCLNCGRLFNEVDGCECWPEEEADLS